MSQVQKIHKKEGKELNEFETEMSAAILAIENETEQRDLRTGLSKMFFEGAAECPLADGTAAIILYVPTNFIKDFRKIQGEVVESLEKKYAGRSVVIFGARTILAKSYKYERPQNRTQTAVHEAWLADMLFPLESVGKRTRYHIDGSKTIKILLDKKHEQDFGPRANVLSQVYRWLTNKVITFEFVNSGEL